MSRRLLGLAAGLLITAALAVGCVPRRGFHRSLPYARPFEENSSTVILQDYSVAGYRSMARAAAAQGNMGRARALMNMARIQQRRADRAANSPEVVVIIGGGSPHRVVGPKSDGYIVYDGSNQDDGYVVPDL